MRWRPDVCGCIITFNGDWQNPVIDEALTVRCPAHANVPDPHKICWNECKAKEGAKSALKATALKDKVLDESDNLLVPWTFTGTGDKRVFTLVPGAKLSAAEKAQAKAAITGKGDVQ